MSRATKALLSTLALTATLAVPATAGAAETTGNTTLVVSAGKAKALAKRGIVLRGIRGASTEGRETRLQVSGGAIGDGAAQLANDGALRLVAGEDRARRVVRLTGLQTQLGPSSYLSANLRGKRRALFDLEPRKGGTLSLDGLRGIASLHGARLVWRRATARTIGRRLGAAIPRGTLGTVRVSAVGTATDTPKSGPLGSSELALLARPASAVEVTGATVTWHVRSSWINYVDTGAGTSAIEGAVPGAATPEDDHPCLDDAGGDPEPRVYSYTFPFANGWYDRPSGIGAIYAGGGTHFSFPGHGIDLVTRHPEIEINGGASRAIFRLNGGGSTDYGDARAALLDLSLTEAPVEGPAGTFTFANEIKGHLTADGLSVFGGFYAPPNNHGFGCFSVSFST
ncbi:MAG TPA: HtaA domain-containing protein [Solirubrobacterales bacterium]|nr:HtaA domain-containing protein [Solirubrobacterales bacterium]